MIYLKIYLLVLKIAFMSFGGAYSVWALIANEAVADCPRAENPSQMQAGTTAELQRHTAGRFYVCRSDFTTILGVAEMLPGPQVNAISMLAFRDYGILGMLIIIAALITPGLLLIPLLRLVEQRLGHSIHVQYFFAGAFFATLAILSVFFFQLAQALTRHRDLKALVASVLIAVAFWLSFRYRLNPLIIATGGAVSGYLLLA